MGGAHDDSDLAPPTSKLVIGSFRIGRRGGSVSMATLRRNTWIDDAEWELAGSFFHVEGIRGYITESDGYVDVQRCGLSESLGFFKPN